MLQKKFWLSTTILLLSCTSLVQAGEKEAAVTIPSFKGGVTASVGTWYAIASSDDVILPDNPDDFHYTEPNYTTDYGFAWQATLGYAFKGTGNSIDLYYRGIDHESDTQTFFIETIGADRPLFDEVTVTDKLEAADLMLSQSMNLGHVMQLRLLGGLAYADIERKDYTQATGAGSDGYAATGDSQFIGWGPRIGIDARYKFNKVLKGVGIVGGGSVAYYIGDLEYSKITNEQGDFSINRVDDKDESSVTNIRINLGLDYLYVFDKKTFSSVGAELGYQSDYYTDGIAQMPYIDVNAVSITYSGPYFNLKGSF